MGLDVTAYSSLSYVGHHEKWTDEDAHYDEHIEAFAYMEFPHALMGVPQVRTSRFRTTPPAGWSASKEKKAVTSAKKVAR